MTNRCVKCFGNFEANYRGNVCDNCSTITPGFPKFIYESRWLDKGKPWAQKISKWEEREISSGVGIPVGNGKFALGRRERGKIVEKPPRGE